MLNLMRKLYSKDGGNKYIRKVLEELNELSCAVSHYSDHKIPKQQVIEEMADVELQMEKLKAWLAGFDEAELAFINCAIDSQLKSKTENLKRIVG